MNGIMAKIRRRPFPLNLHALRACRVSYSQFGEDLFLTLLLGYEKSDGVYVDVGCFQPIVFSNTYIFYQRGWSGLAIDPNPQFRDMWRRFRPRDTFVNVAVSKNNERVTYMMNRQHPAINTVAVDGQTHNFDPSQYEARKCETARLADILDRHLGVTEIDLMNVDCEGADLEVLQTNDWDRYRPTVLAVEDSSISLESDLTRFLLRLNYECRAYIGLTKIFQLKAQ
jgi:FkbM family methyltransferase